MDARADPVTAWRTSSRSADQGNCVEVGRLDPGVVVVRDSKMAGGPRLAFDRAAWREFVRQVRGARP